MARNNRRNTQTPTSTDTTNMTDEQLQPVSDIETETELTTEATETASIVEVETPAVEAAEVVAETPASVEPVVVELATESVVETSIVETPASTVEVSEPAIVEPIAEAPVVVASAPVVTTPDDSVPLYLRAQRDRLTEYAKYMNLETLVSNEVILQQQNLFRLVIQSLLRLRGMEFVNALDELLVFIKANRTKAFHEKYAFREYPNLKISKEERTVLVDVVHLLINICDPDTRRLVMNQIDLSVALNGIRDFDEVRALFHEYITR